MAVASQVIFRVGSERYGVDIYQAGIIEAGVPGKKLPGMPEFVSGFFELRGELIPIISLRDKFHMPQRPASEEIYDFIVSNANGFNIAYDVDCVETILPIEMGEVSKDTDMLIKNANSYMRQVVNANGLIVLIDFAYILSEEQLQELREFLKKSEEDAEK